MPDGHSRPRRKATSSRTTRGRTLDVPHRQWPAPPERSRCRCRPPQMCSAPHRTDRRRVVPRRHPIYWAAEPSRYSTTRSAATRWVRPEGDTVCRPTLPSGSPVGSRLTGALVPAASALRPELCTASVRCPPPCRLRLRKPTEPAGRSPAKRLGWFAKPQAAERPHRQRGGCFVLGPRSAAVRDGRRLACNQGIKTKKPR